MLNLLPKWLENRFEFKNSFLGNLGANTELNLTVPAGKIWIPLSFYSLYVADATVASRIARLYFTDGTNRVAGVAGPAYITAGNSFAVNFANNLIQSSQLGSAISASIPLLPLPEGYKIITATQSIQAGDQYTAVSFSYLEADITEPS